MNSSDWAVLEGLTRLLIIAAATVALYYFGVVVPALYRHGAQFPTGLAVWRYFRDLLGFRATLGAEGKSTNRYYILLFLSWFTILLAIGVGLFYLHLTAEAAMLNPALPR